MTYLPHFLSWVIVYGILLVLLAPGDGIVNDVIEFLGGEPIDFLTDTKTFPWIVILSDAWKEMGWGAIIFIAALMGIDSSLFEAAAVEGASAVQRVWYITLPSIRPVIFMVVLLRLGTILDAGFNQMFMLYSIPVFSVADIIDTWVYRQGLLEFRFGLATAVGLFKGAIGMLLLVFANRVVRRVSDTSII
jgi:putative aldouronate transport system permease protein